MTILTRWFASAVLVTGLGVGALAPMPAQAQDDVLARLLVDIADVVFNDGVPYYRYGDYAYRDRLIVVRDRYGRPLYYRQVPRRDDRRGPPYGNAWGYWRNGPGSRDLDCNRHGKCKVSYYDPRYDRRYYDNGRYRHDRDRWWDGRRWRDDEDDDD